MPISDEQELFALKPGQVSKLKQEAAGYTIYKVESHRTLPLDEVKGTISREIFTQKMQSKMKSVTAGVETELNDDYFGQTNAAPETAKPVAVPVPSTPK